jgi:energy-coupling factor transporter transmembrane protein EcfT
MSKKTNTVLFVLGATIFNILITILCLGVLLFIYSQVLVPMLPEKVMAVGLPIILVGAIALSFVIYRILLKQLLKRVDIEKYFEPIFGHRRSGNKKPQD